MIFFNKVLIEVSANNQHVISEKELKLGVGYYCTAT